MMTDVATCSSCGAAIAWARTSSGKAIPLDAQPDPAGNLLAVDQYGVTLPAPVALAAMARGYRTIVVARRGHRSIDPGLPYWRSHFATCVNAEHHRRARALPRRQPQGEPIQSTLPL